MHSKLKRPLKLTHFAPPPRIAPYLGPVQSTPYFMVLLGPVLWRVYAAAKVANTLPCDAGVRLRIQTHVSDRSRSQQKAAKL